MQLSRLFTVVTLALLPGISTAQVRIKDITDVDGARGNQLYGFGLVVGLDGTGSRSTFTQKVATEMLQKMNHNATIFSQLPSDNVIRSTSISAVMVTAELGAFVRKGGKIDVQVSALDDARSLVGGMLIFTPLKGADGETYAVAQGPLSVGGFAISGQGARLQKNQLNVGRIPNGAMVEKEALAEVFQRGKFRLLLKEADFNTSRLITKAINERHPETATAQDAGAIVVCVPHNKSANATGFLSEVGLYEVVPDVPARIVINERTGTIVAGENVTISSTAVAHGNLFLTTSENPQVSQPNPLGQGTTAVVPRTQVSATEQRAKFNVLPKSMTVAEVARAMNALGASPQDLISVFQALKQAGALHAEIVTI